MESGESLQRMTHIKLLQRRDVVKFPSFRLLLIRFTCKFCHFSFDYNNRIIHFV